MININKKSLLKSLGMTLSIFSVAIFTAWAWHHAPWAIVIILFIMAAVFFYIVFDNK